MDWSWTLGCVLLLASCTRDNPAYGTDDFSGSTGNASHSADNTGSGPDSSPGSGDGGATGADGSTTLFTTGNDTNATTGADGPNVTTGNDSAGGDGPGVTAGTTTGAPPPESCCSSDGSCENPLVAECACTAAPERCCDGSWDAYCVVVAMAEACVDCGPPPVQDCCQGAPLPGCANLDVMLCVCSDNPSCCDIAWEQSCADAAVDCPSSPCA